MDKFIVFSRAHVVFLTGHNIAADYWALGVLMYELLCGQTPFARGSKDDMEILNHITTFDPKQIEWPEGVSIELKDIITKLLSPDLTDRLGFRDQRTNFAQSACDAIKTHSFFTGTSWDATKKGSFAVRIFFPL